MILDYFGLVRPCQGLILRFLGFLSIFPSKAHEKAGLWRHALLTCEMAVGNGEEKIFQCHG